MGRIIIERETSAIHRHEAKQLKRTAGCGDNQPDVGIEKQPYAL
jgi:hypothetical protein